MRLCLCVSPPCQDEKWGKPIESLRVLNAAQVAAQPIPQYLSLSYDNLFKVQRVRNPFPLRPVSYSALATYLECPWCALMQKRKKRTKEATKFTSVRQSTLFGGGQPDARMVGTLLHTLVNLLHDPNSPLAKEEQAILLADSDALTRFIRRDLLATLQRAGKINLAMFFNELNSRTDTAYTTVISPVLRYQRNLMATGTRVFTAAERFQFKLLSTKNTFAGHPDRGGYVGFVGEFDQIRLRDAASGGVPSIIEFKKGLGGKKKPEAPPQGLFAELGEEKEQGDPSPSLVLPTVSHAMQLMVYWLAFQTRWDLIEMVKGARGALQEIAMPLQQSLELILYNLNDGCQYQLQPSNHKEALLALIECIFYLDWAMKSGYARQSPEHSCQRTQLTAVPDHVIQVQVGSTALTAHECYLLAREAFKRFENTIQWEKLPPSASRL